MSATPTSRVTPGVGTLLTRSAVGLAALLPGGAAWAAPSPDPVTLGVGGLIGGLGVIGLTLGIRWLQRRTPRAPTEPGEVDRPQPQEQAPQAPVLAAEVRQQADPVDIVALTEALVMGRHTQPLRPDVELGWIARLDAPLVLALDLSAVQSLVGDLLDDALARTERGSVTLHVEAGTRGGVCFEVEDSAESSLAQATDAQRSAVARMGGTISIEAEPGVGSLVSVSLPGEPLPMPASHATPAAPGEPATGTVQVVQATPLAMATLETQLARLGVALSPTTSDDRGLRVEGTSVYKGSREVAQLPLRTSDWQRLLVRPSAGTPHVLLVEDCDSNALIVERLLTPLGAHVVRVTNGQDALSAYRQADFDLVLMDCEMPGWNGIRSTAELRRWEMMERRSPVPILVTTAHTRSRIWDRFAAVGATDTLQTPLRRAQLSEVLKVWVGKATDGGTVPEPAPIEPVVRPPASPTAHLDTSLFTLSALEPVLEMGPDQFAHLVQVWSHSVKHLRKVLHDGIVQRDGARVRTAAHTLKSSTASMGLLGLREIFVQVERLAELQALGAAATLVDSITDDFDRAVAQLAVSAETCRSVQVVAPQAPHREGFRVLVVDDDPFIRSAVTRALEQAGCVVEATATGESALESARRTPPEMVLLDVQMPGIDGFTTCARLRENNDTADVPVLIMTGQDDVRSVERAFEVGANDFIGKPFNPQLLQHRARFLRRAHNNLVELREKRERIQVLAFTDRVTGLPNRVRLLKELEAAHAERVADAGAPGVGVVFIDLDRFKAVNDTLGHAAGDQLLRAVGRRLQITLDNLVAARPDISGHMLARIGGDEFVVLLRGVDDRAAARAMALPLVETTHRPFKLGEHTVQIGASAGVAVYPIDGTTVDGLITTADSAMYRVKRVGGNGIRGGGDGPEVGKLAENTLLIELQRAIREDELEVYLQPRVDSGLGEVLSAEALVRWRHPERGLLLPGVFIGLAEEHGLIVELGRRVLIRSLDAIKHLDSLGVGPPSVSVNISAVQLQEPSFADEVLDTLRQSGVSPDRLELEVTETAVIDNFNLAVASLSRLREHGITVAIDDFGTGHASLHYLHRLPVDVLKIDRSFVDLLTAGAGTTTTSGPGAIVGMLLALGEALDLRVVAEGVETKEQLARLCRMGCDELQGFLISRPLPIDRFIEFMQQRQRQAA